MLLFKTCTGPGQALLLDMCRFPCRDLPEHWNVVCSRDGGWCTNGFLNHSVQTTVERTNTLSLTGWSQRDLLAQKHRGKRVG